MGGLARPFVRSGVGWRWQVVLVWEVVRSGGWLWVRARADGTAQQAPAVPSSVRRGQRLVRLVSGAVLAAVAARCPPPPPPPPVTVPYTPPAVLLYGYKVPAFPVGVAGGCSASAGAGASRCRTVFEETEGGMGAFWGAWGRPPALNPQQLRRRRRPHPPLRGGAQGPLEGALKVHGSYSRHSWASGAADSGMAGDDHDSSAPNLQSAPTAQAHSHGGPSGRPSSGLTVPHTGGPQQPWKQRKRRTRLVHASTTTTSPVLLGCAPWAAAAAANPPANPPALPPPPSGARPAHLFHLCISRRRMAWAWA